jgi:cytochrome c-type biogenesis protein CcmH/NrfG
MCSVLLGGGSGLPRETVIPALLARATAYTALGKDDKAIKDLQRIIRLDEENYNAYYRLAFAYEKEQQYDLAVQVYDALLSKSPAQSDAACFRNRDQALLNNVNASPESCGGKTSITGTR